MLIEVKDFDKGIDKEPSTSINVLLKDLKDQEIKVSSSVIQEKEVNNE